MAEIKIQYCCGCGFKTADSDAAVDHCVLKAHTLTVYGVIRSEKHRSRTVTEVTKKSDFSL